MRTFFGIALFSLSACSSAQPTRATREAASAPAVANTRPTTELRNLDVPGHLPALLFVPAGTEKRPLLVATHGAGGSPEWECDYWPRLVKGHSFVLCLRGKSMGPNGGFYYPSHLALDAELQAALTAAQEAEPRISRKGGVYAGYSQGASMGSLMLPEHGGRLPYAILIEGFERWSLGRSQTFAKLGGQRVAFACGTASCNNAAKGSSTSLEKAGVRTRVSYAAGAGHTPTGEVMAHVQATLPWLLDGEASWQ